MYMYIEEILLSHHLGDEEGEEEEVAGPVEVRKVSRSGHEYQSLTHYAHLQIHRRGQLCLAVQRRYSENVLHKRQIKCL